MTKTNIWKRVGKIALIILILLIALVLFFLIGTMIGYSVIGDGNIGDVFSGQFWQTLFGFLTA